jgi:hypothetical protein
MAHRLAPEAATELDGIWYFVARESCSVDIADEPDNSAEASKLPGRSRCAFVIP